MKDYRVVVGYESIEGERMEMWSRPLENEKAYKLCNRYKKLGIPAEVKRVYEMRNYTGSAENRWCRKI